MSDSVCIGCGLCCDGTVVSHLAVVDESDVGAPLRGLGVSIIVEADPPVFALPCPAVVDGTCSVHSLHRPRACGEFECGVSRSVLEGSLSVDDARHVIDEAKRLRADVARGAAEADELDELLDRRFRWWSERAVPPRAPGST